MKVKFMLNHSYFSFDVEPGEYLLDTLRRHHIYSVKKGCDDSSCGVCSILVNDKPVLSCTVLTAQVNDAQILTVEGIKEEVEKISKYFGIEGADQCGFCNPGMAIMAYALKKENPNATDDYIKKFFVGNLCRCSGYQAQFYAVKKYLGDQS